MPYVPKMDCPDCADGTYEVLGRYGFTELQCEECDGTGEVDASTCAACDCRTDLHEGFCPACIAAEAVIDNSTIPTVNHEALATAIRAAITEIMAAKDWTRPVNPKIDLNARNPYHEFQARGVAA